MSSTHTPGPWEVELRTGMARSHYGHNVSCTLHKSPGCVSGCCSVAEVRGHDDTEAVANAYLIAAAPDLLAACEQALNIIALNDDAPNTVAQLQSAISKARGHQ